ncbi:MAG: manganese-dependent inorganic pyrophosphatase [Thermoleophilaceae bacterium]|nr:manganese-dependent inorganic pyrophosphatase [Thermoleophilaceae bacterium]
MTAATTAALPRVYVCGHRSPDTDSIASAIGYAELKNHVDDALEYVPVRLGVANAQTEWLLERSGAQLPVFLPHAKLRVRDVMRTSFPVANVTDPVRTVGLLMAPKDIVPIVGDDGVLRGVLTERALARRYIRESRDASRLDVPTPLRSIVEVLEGKLVAGDPDREIQGRVWVQAMHSTSPSKVGPGDVVVVGDRPKAQTQAIEQGAALLVLSNGVAPEEEILALAREHGTAIVGSQLDSYVTSRMITLSEPCHALIEGDPLTVGLDDLVSDTAAQIKDVHYRAAVAVDSSRRPIGLVTRTDLVNPRPRRVLLVDHAEAAQSVPGVEQAEIVEILDHHHIGSIETTVPVRATFDPVGSTATLVIERFRQNGMEPSRSTATLLLGAILSDTVILNSPTVTERDRATVEYLERVLALDAIELGREMFVSTSDLSRVPAEAIVSRDAKEYEAGPGQTVAIAQVETVGQRLGERREELLEALREARERRGHALFALMVTDILAKHTDLYVAGETGPLEAAFGAPVNGGVIELPGVMSRKKQVAPKVLAAF